MTFMLKSVRHHLCDPHGERIMIAALGWKARRNLCERQDILRFVDDTILIAADKPEMVEMITEQKIKRREQKLWTID